MDRVDVDYLGDDVGFLGLYFVDVINKLLDLVPKEAQIVELLLVCNVVGSWVLQPNILILLILFENVLALQTALFEVRNDPHDNGRNFLDFVVIL